MPALDGDNPGVAAVAAFASLLRELLEEATVAKTTFDIEPALNKSDFDDITNRVLSAVAQASGPEEPIGTDASSQIKGRKFAIIETAARELFSELIVGRHDTQSTNNANRGR